MLCDRTCFIELFCLVGPGNWLIMATKISLWFSHFLSYLHFTSCSFICLSDFFRYSFFLFASSSFLLLSSFISCGSIDSCVHCFAGCCCKQSRFIAWSPNIQRRSINIVVSLSAAAGWQIILTFACEQNGIQDQAPWLMKKWFVSFLVFFFVWMRTCSLPCIFLGPRICQKHQRQPVLYLGQNWSRYRALWTVSTLERLYTSWFCRIGINELFTHVSQALVQAHDERQEKQHTKKGMCSQLAHSTSLKWYFSCCDVCMYVCMYVCMCT